MQADAAQKVDGGKVFSATASPQSPEKGRGLQLTPPRVEISQWWGRGRYRPFRHDDMSDQPRALGAVVGRSLGEALCPEQASELQSFHWLPAPHEVHRSGQATGWARTQNSVVAG